MRSWTRLLTCTVALLLAAPGLAADRARVAVLPLEHHGPMNEGVRSSLSRQLRQGLSATGLDVIGEEKTRPALGDDAGGCVDPRCRRMVAGKLGCRFIAGGSVRADEDRSYVVELWLADGYSGEVVARVKQHCEICGLKAVSERMDLAASALGAKARATTRVPARLVVSTAPPEASVEVDGDPVGNSPQELELAAGAHRIVVRAPGYLAATRTVQAVAGVEERVRIKLIPAGPKRSWHGIAGWTVLGGALVSLAVATTLFAVDGGDLGCEREREIPGGQCPQIRDTRAGAWTAAGIGLGASVLGVYLLLKQPPRRTDAALAPGGLPLRAEF